MPFRINMIRLILRISLFVVGLRYYLAGTLENITQFRFFSPPSWLHVLWFALFLEMLIQFIPALDEQIGPGKQYARHLKPRPFLQHRLEEQTKKDNRGAAITMVTWLTVNGIFGLLHLMGRLETGTMLMLSLFFYISDLICVLIWCPFQYINKNRCCVTCRIYNWGFFMLYLPCAFVPGFFTRSLFATSVAILLWWEYQHYRHPERFWEGSNASLNCAHCTDKMCRIKSPYFPQNDTQLPPCPQQESTVTEER